MRIALRYKQQHIAVDVHREGGTYRIVIGGAEHIVEMHDLSAATLSVVVDGRIHRVDVARNARERLVAVCGEAYTFMLESGAPAGHSVAGVAMPEIVAPMPGKVLQVLVRSGDRVAAGDGLLILEAMKMENRLVAEAPGTVVDVRVAPGDMVDGGQVLIVLAYDEEFPT